jgi:hypothetical protein
MMDLQPVIESLQQVVESGNIFTPVKEVLRRNLTELETAKYLTE